MRFSLVVLRVADLHSSKGFYSALGLEFKEEQHGSGPLHLAADLGGIVLELYPSTATSRPTANVRIGLCVDDLEAMLERAALAGGAIVTAPSDSPWGKRGVVSDPDGNRIELVQDDAAAPLTSQRARTGINDGNKEEGSEKGPN